MPLARLFLFFLFISITSPSRLRKQLPISIENKQARQVWQNFMKRDVSISVQYVQESETEATIFSAYAGTLDEMSLLFSIHTSTKTNQIWLKFRTEKDQIKNYILSALLNGEELHKMIFALEDEVFQLSLDCNQLIKAVDRHLSFRLKQNQTRLKIYLGDDIRELGVFKGTTRHYAIERGNPTSLDCLDNLEIALLNPIKIIFEEDVTAAAHSGKTDFSNEMITRQRLELEKNVKERLESLENEMRKWRDNVRKLESKVAYLESIQSKPKQEKRDTHQKNGCGTHVDYASFVGVNHPCSDRSNGP